MAIWIFTPTLGVAGGVSVWKNRKSSEAERAMHMLVAHVGPKYVNLTLGSGSTGELSSVVGAQFGMETL